jgi:hypothetical protein
MVHPSTLLSVATFLALMVAVQMSENADIEFTVLTPPPSERIGTTGLSEAATEARDLASLATDYD